jgi:predicted transcriptional regulator
MRGRVEPSRRRARVRHSLAGHPQHLNVLRGLFLQERTVFHRLLTVNNSESTLATILSVSLPAELRSALDAEAKRQRRSRSFVVAEAVRDYVARQERDAFTAARERTIREGLALALAARVQLSEELWQEFVRGRKPPKPWTRTFDTFEEYDRWRRR